MKIRRKSRFASEVSTSALNDIMFFLLLFFLIISTVANPSVIKLMLPRASSAQAISKQIITLSVTADKSYYINNKAIVREQLETRLTEMVASMPEPTVLLRADQSLTIQDLVDVMQVGAKLKIKMVLATASPK
jgi:biopolymer transport protein ExbD